jgi:hypothetical protein
MRLFPAVLANLLLLFAAFGLGSFLRPLFPQNFLKVDRIAAIALGGLGLLGTLLFVVGMHHFSLVVILAVLLPAALFGLVFIRKELRGPANHLRFENIPLLPVAVIALILIITLLGGLAEPVGDIKMDAIAYHFLGPRVWLRDSVIHVIPDECHASFPATVETLFAALMAVGGTRAPELFAFVAFAILLLIAAGFAIRMGLDPPGVWWAVVLTASMPVVYRGSYGGFNDAVLSSFLLLAVRLALDAGAAKDYALAGIFAGLAMGTKYTAVIAFLLILGCAFLSALVRRAERPAKAFAGLTLFATIASLIASPWYLRNWLVLGSPIYPPPPVLLRFFHVKYMSPDAIHALAAMIQKEGLGMGHTLASFLLLPLHLTIHPANFLNGAGGVGVALLALAPFGLLMQRRDLFVRMLVLFAFLQTAAWFLTEQDARFLIHLYVILAIFAIWGWRYVAAKAPRFGPWLSGLAVACSILYGLFMIGSSRVDDLHAAVSSSYEKQRISREVPFLESFAYLNADTAAKKVLVLEPRVPTFYLQKDYLKPVGRFGEQTVPEANDFRLLSGKLASYGITHILDVRLEDKEILHDFRVPPDQTNLQLIFEREDQRVYRVAGAN